MATNGDYTVGYGKPPTHARFQPGQSGNPKGRPKNRETLSTVLDKVLSEKITIRIGNGERRVSLQEAVILRVANNAIAGNMSAARLLISLLTLLRADPQQASEEKRTGVLVVPGPCSTEEWEEQVKMYRQAEANIAARCEEEGGE